MLFIREETAACDAEKPEFTKDAVMSEYSDIFGEELGHMHGRESAPWIRYKCYSYSYAATSCTCCAYRETEEWNWLLNSEESDQPYSRTYRLGFKHDCSQEARREHSFVHWSPLLKSSLKWKPLPSPGDRRVISNKHNYPCFTCVSNLSRFKST